jgi:hypothetical protein
MRYREIGVIKSLCRAVGLLAPLNNTVTPVLLWLTSITIPVCPASSGHRAAPSSLILKRVPTTNLLVS